MITDNTRELAHLTLNTGDLRMSPRSEVLPETVKILAPLIQDGCGVVMGTTVETRLFPGRASITLSNRYGAYAVCCLVWDPGKNAKVWSSALLLARAQGIDILAKAPPAHSPWLGVLLLPEIIALGQESLMALADLERCVAWTILDRKI